MEAVKSQTATPSVRSASTPGFVTPFVCYHYNERTSPAVPRFVSPVVQTPMPSLPSSVPTIAHCPVTQHTSGPPKPEEASVLSHQAPGSNDQPTSAPSANSTSGFFVTLDNQRSSEKRVRLSSGTSVQPQLKKAPVGKYQRQLTFNTDSVKLQVNDAAVSRAVTLPQRTTSTTVNPQQQRNDASIGHAVTLPQRSTSMASSTVTPQQQRHDASAGHTVTLPQRSTSMGSTNMILQQQQMAASSSSAVDRQLATCRQIYEKNPEVLSSASRSPSFTVNTNNNNSNALGPEDEPISPLCRARDNMKEMLKKVSEDCTRVEAKSKEMVDVLSTLSGAENANERRWSTPFSSSHPAGRRLRTTKAEREHCERLRDNLVAKLRSLQSSSRELESVLKLLHKLEKDVQLKSIKCFKELDVAKKSNEVLKSAVVRQDDEMKEMSAYIGRLESQVACRKQGDSVEIIQLIETTEKMKSEMVMMHSNHAALVEESQRVLERLGVSEEENGNLKETLEVANREKELFQKEAKENKREMENQKKKIEEGKKQLVDMQQKMNEFRNEMQFLLLEVQRRSGNDEATLGMQKTIDHLQLQIDNHVEEKASLERALEVVEEEAQMFKTSEMVRVAEEERDNAKAVLGKVKTYLLESTTELKKMDGEAEALERSLATAESEVTTLKEEVERLNCLVDAYEKKTQVALDENKILRNLCDNQKGRLEHIEAEKDEETAKSREFRTKMWNYVEGLQSMPEQLKVVEMELVKAKTELAEYREQIRRRDAEQEESHLQHQSTVLQQEKALLEAKQQKAALEEELSIRQRQLEIADDQAEERAKEAEAMEVLKKEIARMHKKEEEDEETLKHFVEAYQQKQRSEHDIGVENSSLKKKIQCIQKMQKKIQGQLEATEKEKERVVDVLETEKRRLFSTLTSEKEELMQMLEEMRIQSTAGLEAAEEERRRVEEEMRSKEEEMRSKEEEVVKRDVEVRKKEEEIALLTKEKETLMEEISVMKEKEGVMEELLRRSDEEKERDEEKAEDARKAQDDLTASALERQQEVNRLKAELELSKAENENFRVDFEEKIQTEYAEKLGALQQESKVDKKEKKRLAKHADSLSDELKSLHSKFEEEKLKRQNLERYLQRLRGLHSRLFPPEDLAM